MTIFNAIVWYFMKNQHDEIINILVNGGFQ